MTADVQHVRIPKRNGEFRDIYILRNEKLKTQAKLFSKVLLEKIDITMNLKNFRHKLITIADYQKPELITLENISSPVLTDEQFKDFLDKIKHLPVLTNVITFHKLYTSEVPFIVYETDIKNCFHSIDVNQFPYRFDILEKIRENLKIDKNALYLQTQKKLIIPQGFPASPIIVDFILRSIDYMITSFLNNLPYPIKILRYADNYFVFFLTKLPQAKIDSILKYITHIILSRKLNLKHKFKLTNKIIGLTLNGYPHPDTLLQLLAHAYKGFDQHVFNGVVGYLSQFDYFDDNYVINELKQYFITKGGKYANIST